jgi:YD repeat-containing protein
LLTLTDCSGYQTRYEYNRFGQMTAIYQEEGLSQYRAMNGAGLFAGKMLRAMKRAMSTAWRATSRP